MKKRRYVAAMMAAAMVMGTSMTAFAETEGETISKVETIPLTKVVTADGNTYAPNTTFTFEVSKAVAGTVSFEKDVTYKAGVDGGLTWTKVENKEKKTVEYTPADGIIDDGLSKSLSLTVNPTAFGETGVYAYTVKETKGEYDGITYDEKEYLVLLYIMEDNGTKYCGDVVVSVGGKKADNLIFTNDYGKTNDVTHDLTIKKTVTGNMGERNKDFSFKITINGESGEKYKAIKTEKGGATTELTFVSGTTNDITLKDTETIQLFGLSENDKYTVVETDYDGYTTTGEVANATVTKDKTVVDIINEKNVAPATGIAMTFGPYVLLVGLAGGLGAMFLRKKEREDF